MIEALLIVFLLLAMWASTLVKDPPIKYKLDSVIVRFTINTQNFTEAMEELAETFTLTSKHIEDFAKVMHEEGGIEVEGKWEW